MKYIQPADRGQYHLMSSLDDLVAPDHPVRIIDKIVDSIVLSEKDKFEPERENESGRAAYQVSRPAFHASTHLKLYLYEYFNGLSSSRKLEVETHRNKEVISLLGNLTPDHWTISNYRKEKGENIKFVTKKEWIQKGKSGNRVELGLKVAIGTDQYGFILTHRVMTKEQDVDAAIPMAEKIKEKYRVGSVSFDKGFWSPKNKEKIGELIDVVVMPKKGKLNKEELEYEGSKKFKALRKHPESFRKIESNINSLEHHGLNRCPDKGIRNFKKYTALGILSYNLHILGKLLIDKSRRKDYKKAA